jgi:predicted Zn-dependent peptidase
LRIPFAAGPDLVAENGSHAAVAEMLSATLFGGTGRRSRGTIADALADAGAQVRVRADPQRLTVIGRALEAGLGDVLAVLADCLTDARYPSDIVASERERMLARVRMTHAVPRSAALMHVLRHCFGSSPIVEQTPSERAVAEVPDEAIRALHRSHVVPRGSVLTLVGDLDPTAATDLVERTFTGWTADHAAYRLVTPAPMLDAPVRRIPCPGLRQAEVRLAGPAVPLDDPTYPAQCLADHLAGGYFLSRLVRHLREDKGYIYAGSSSLHQYEPVALSLIEFATAPENLDPALAAAFGELDRLSGAGTPDRAEVDAARAHLVGTLAISLSTQAGLVESLASLGSAGLDYPWLQQHLERLGQVSTEQVVQVLAERYRADRFTGVVLV